MKTFWPDDQSITERRHLETKSHSCGSLVAKYKLFNILNCFLCSKFFVTTQLNGHYLTERYNNVKVMVAPEEVHFYTKISFLNRELTHLKRAIDPIHPAGNFRMRKQQRWRSEALEGKMEASDDATVVSALCGTQTSRCPRWFWTHFQSSSLFPHHHPILNASEISVHIHIAAEPLSLNTCINRISHQFTSTLHWKARC